MAKLTCGLLAALGAAAFGLSSPPSASGADEPISDDVPLVEVAAYVQARSAFQRHCYRCHLPGGEETTKKSLERLDMGRYPFGGRRGAAAGKYIRVAMGGVEGGKATMPKDDPGVVQGEDLASILRWADTFDATRAAPKDRGSTADGGTKLRRSPAPAPTPPPATPPAPKPAPST